MLYYAAPMEGITTYIYRRAKASRDSGSPKNPAPRFLAVTVPEGQPRFRLTVSSREIIFLPKKTVEPDQNRNQTNG